MYFNPYYSVTFIFLFFVVQENTPIFAPDLLRINIKSHLINELNNLFINGKFKECSSY